MIDSNLIDLSNEERLALIEFLQAPNGASKDWGRYHRVHAESVQGGGILLRLHDGASEQERARRKRIEDAAQAEIWARVEEHKQREASR